MSLILLADGSTGGGLAGTVADWATKIMDVAGSPGAGLANALDSIIPVLPSEVILPLAGFAASRGSINLYAALVWTTIGSIVGSVAMYYIGAAFGRDRVLRWAAKIPLVQVHEVERTEAFFRKHGTKAVFFGRFIPVFRSLISLPAGLERMPLLKFTLLSAAGSVIWNTVFVLAGYSLGANWEKVEQYGSYFSKAVIALIVLAIAYFVISRLLRRRRAARRDDPDDRDGLAGTGPDDHPGFAAYLADPDDDRTGLAPPTTGRYTPGPPVPGPDPAGRHGAPPPYPSGPADRAAHPAPADHRAPHPGSAGGPAPFPGAADHPGPAGGPAPFPGPAGGPAPFPPPAEYGAPQHAPAPVEQGAPRPTVQPGHQPPGYATGGGRHAAEAPRHAAEPAPVDGRYAPDRPGDRSAPRADHGAPPGRPDQQPDSEPTLVKRFHGTVYGQSRPTEPDARPDR